MPAAERFRAIVEMAVDAVISIDAAGIIQTFNPAAERLFGYRADEVMGGNVRVLMNEDDGRRHDGYIQRVLDGGDPHIIGVGREVTGRHRDGTPLALHLSVGATHIDGAPGFVGIMRDIRPQVALREALRTRDAEYAAVAHAMTDGLVVQRADGEIVTANAAAHRILGHTAGHLTGRTGVGPVGRAIREDGTDIPPAEHPPTRTLRTGQRVDGMIMGIEHPDGERAWVEVSSFPVELRGETRPGAATVFRDVTGARAAAALLADRERSFRLLAENSTDVVVRTHWDSTIAYISPRIRQLLGFDPEALRGRRLTELIHPDDRPRNEDAQGRIEARGEVTTTQLRLRLAHGGWEWCEATVREVPGPDGRTLERQAAIRSIARRKRDEANLAESLARYRALIGHLPGTAVLMFDHDLRVVVADGPATTTLVDRDDPAGLRMAELVPEGDRTTILDRCRRTLAGESHAWRMHKKGRVLDTTLTPVEVDGLIIGGMVVAIDVTERAALEAEQEALHDIAHAVAGDVAPDEVLALVADRVSSLFGAVGAAVFRCAGPEVVAVATAPRMGTAIQPGDRFAAIRGSALSRVLTHRTPAAVADYGDTTDPLVVALRTIGAVGGAAAPVIVRGQLWGAVGFGGADPALLDELTAHRLGRFAELVATTIANADEWQRLRQQATTDGLTGLANRAAFNLRVAEEIVRLQRGGARLAVVMLDVDHFKQVNDRHGHAVGDQVLASIATALRGAARGSDMVARIGGEEFAWLMPGVGITHALAAVERVRRAVAGPPHGPAGTVTISAGVAMANAVDDEHTVITRADRALYAAKDAGRNTVVLWSPGIDPRPAHIPV